MTQYQHLTSPLRIGPITIKNRVIFGPHVTNHWSSEFLVTPQAMAYYEERARGGVGMIILGSAPVDETADYCPFTQPGVFKDEVIPGLKQLADTVHQHGAKILQQIIHPGSHQLPDRNSNYPGRAPSQIPAIEEPFFIPKALEVEEIAEIQEKFAAAAERVQRAGFDGVEVHGAHGYLPWSFITPLKNKRTDHYGGSLENRFRFLGETLEKIRARVGKDFVVGVRTNSTDMVPGGMDVDDCVRVAKMIERTGVVDYISVSMGLYRSVQFIVPSHYSGFEPGYQGEFTRKIKSEISTVPVFQVGRINDPALAEHIIAEGAADGVMIIRELIAEPHFVAKATSGREDDIRPCIYCNQKCIAHIFTPSAHVECNVNPAAGEEYRMGSWTFKRAARAKKVMIIGGGPAGLECARTAAARGHEAVIYEKGNVVGGQMQLMCKLPGRAEPKNFLDWLEGRTRSAGVRFEMSSEITAENADLILLKEKPDAIVVATGARAARDGRSSITTEPIPGWERGNVLTYEQALTLDPRRDSIGKRVLIIDELGERTTPGLAEILVPAGKQVEVITRWPNMAHMWSTLWLEMPMIYARMDELGVKITPMTWVKEINPSSVTCFNIFTGREWTVPADSVILVTMKYSNVEPYEMLKGKGVKPLYLIGDAKAPRQIGEAVRDGHALARDL